MSTAAMPAPRTTWRTVVGRTLVFVIGFFCWALSSTATSPLSTFLLFAVAIAAFGYALSRIPLLAVGVVGFACIGVSSKVPWLEPVGFCVWALIPVYMLWMFIAPGPRSVESAFAAEWLANGPLVPVATTICEYRVGRRAMDWLTGISAGLTLLGVALLVGGNEIGILAAPAAIMAATFGAIDWASRRLRFRIDSAGLEQVGLFRTRRIAWSGISNLTLTVFTNFRTGIMTYRYRVQSPATEVTFDSTISGAEQLRDTIEAAAGMTWGEPETGTVTRDRGTVPAGRAADR